MTPNANDNGHVPLASRVNQFVGNRIRIQRESLRLSAAELAHRLQVSETQLADFENGVVRVSASLLYDMSLGLSVPVAFFFQGFGGD